MDWSGFSANVKVEEIASKIVGFLGTEHVLFVQFMPSPAIQVTFEATVVRELVCFH